MTEADRLGPFRAVLERIRQREDSHNSETLYFPEANKRDLLMALGERAQSSVSRLQICTSAPQAGAGGQSALWQDLAEAGIEVRAIYLVAHLGLLDTVLRQQLRDDLDRGI